jgi:hypothetical protein
MFRIMLSGLFGLIAVSAGLVWILVRSNRTPTDDRVTSNVLARINTEYKDNP